MRVNRFPRMAIWRLAIHMAAALSLSPAPGLAQPAGPREMKVAITYNIMQFVRLANHDPLLPLELCVARDDPMEPSLRVLRGQPIGKAVVRVREVTGSLASFRGCHVAYLGAGSRGFADQLSRSGVLTVGEGEDFIATGGIVGLVGSGRQVRFYINYGAAERSQIRISSKLLRLAVRVVE